MLILNETPYKNTTDAQNAVLVEPQPIFFPVIITRRK